MSTNGLKAYNPITSEWTKIASNSADDIFIDDKSSFFYNMSVKEALNYLLQNGGGSGMPTINVTGVTLNKTTTSLINGGTEQLVATISPSNATNQSVNWSSSNVGVATVSATGLITSVGVGTCAITVTTIDGSKSAACSLTVSASNISVTSIALNKNTSTLSVNSTEQLTVTFTPSNATNQNINWTSSDNNVATVSASGLVTGKAEGNATITATSADGNKTATCNYTIAAQSNILYQLPNATTFNGTSTFVDTGVKLFDTDKSWTILLNFTGSASNQNLSNKHILLHCMNEAGSYNGISISINTGNGGCYNLDYYGKNTLDDTIGIKSIAYNNTATNKIAIVRTQGSNTLKYYLNNTTEHSVVSTNAFATITQNLLLGCYQTTAGAKGRYWNGTINSCVVHSTAMTAPELNSFFS